MPKEGIWIEDEETKQPTFVYYEDLDPDILGQLWKPVGGFCYGAHEFARLRLPSVPFYIKDWLPKQGKAVLYAPPKTGKSFLCLQIGDSIGSGVDLLGLPVTQGTVLYIQFELGAEILQGRIHSTGQDYENVYVGTTFTMKLDRDAGQRLLWDALEAVKPNVLILDPFYKTLQGDENESSDVRKITDFLDSVIEGFNCSILVIHHPGKDITRGGRGSSVLEDWVDSYIEMRKLSKNGEHLRVKITPKLLRHAELPPEPIEAEMRDFVFERVDATPTVRQMVEAYIKIQAETTTPKDLFEAGIGSQKSVYDALKTLVRDGVVVKVGRGEYIHKESGGL